MNEVEYCTGCAISMIITCKIDYSKIFFCNIQSSLSLFFFFILPLPFLPLSLSLSPLLPLLKGYRHAISPDRLDQIAYLPVVAVVLRVSSIGGR